MAHHQQAGQAQPAIRVYRRAASAAQRICANAEATRLYAHLLEGARRQPIRDGETIQQVVDKIMGESEFNGPPDHLVWAGT